MARPAKIEISAVNLRIPSDRERDYPALLQKLYDSKIGVRVHGEKYVAVSYFDASGFGVFSKYSEIDIDGDWFDVDGFEVASDEALKEINIPENLRPNHSAFYFQLNKDLHTISFETYSESKTLSANSVEKS